ncbi:MAG: hypothetical protein ACK4FJ_18695 [Ferrovibrio sp.]|uniref:hypothetical protein n=1 Tax=Ferrovibrio sp. TaxID=1917215 RepID=UPI00391C7D7D
MAKTKQTYLGNGNHQWEPVAHFEPPFGNAGDSTARLRVPGGWLYRTVVMQDGEVVASDSVFVPLPSIVGKPI